MKQERILYALGNVADEFIMESMPAEEKRRNIKWMITLCAAAALLIVIGLSYHMTRQQQMDIVSEMAEAEQEAAEIETGDDTDGPMEQSSSADERFVDVKKLLALAENGQTAVAEDARRILQVPVGKYTAIYEGIGDGGGEAFREQLYAAKGALFSEREHLSYVSGHTDKQYLIRTDGDDVSLWKFVCFNTENYPFRDVLTEVYDVHSGEGFAELVITAGNMDNTPEGIRIQQEIGTHTVTDRSEMNELYRVLSGMTCYGPDRWDLIQTGGQDWDVSAAMMDEHQEVRLTRYLTIVTPYNEIDSLKYTAVSDMFYEFGGVAYESLPAEDAETIRKIIGVEKEGGEARASEKIPDTSNPRRSVDGEERRAAYSHDGTELSLALPAGWSYRICSAKECAEMDGMMLFGIIFWPDKEPEIELSYGYYDFAGMCGTGVTIEELILDSGVKAWKYTEVYAQEHRKWMSVVLEPDGWKPADGSCMMECAIGLDQWTVYEDAIAEIVETLEFSKFP